MVRVSLTAHASRGVADSFGVAKSDAMLEPEVIGRLLPDAPAERVEVPLGELKPYLVKGLLATEDRYFYYHRDSIRFVSSRRRSTTVRAHRLARAPARSRSNSRERSWSATSAASPQIPRAGGTRGARDAPQQK